MIVKQKSISSYILATLAIFLTLSIPFVGMINVVFAAEGVIETIRVGSTPDGVAYSSYNKNMYVTTTISDSVSVIDGATNRVIDTVDVGAGPLGIAYNPQNDNMYATNSGSDTASVIDGDTNRVIDTIDVGNERWGVGYSSGNGNMYVTNSGSRTVSVIDGDTNQVIDTIRVGMNPHNVAYNPSNSNMYVTNFGSGTTSVIGETTSSPPPGNEEPETISDLIKGIIQNPLDVTNSIDSANEIRDILTDGNEGNDRSACNLLNQFGNEQTTDNIRGILNC